MKNWSFIDVVGSLNVLIAAVYAYLTYRIVRASREQTEASIRPYITVHHALSTETVITLFIRNTGKSNASNLRLKLNKDFFQFGSTRKSDNLADLFVFNNMISSFAPGSELQFPLETSLVLQSKDPNQADEYIFQIEASYSFFGKTVKETTVVDLRCYMGIWMPQPTIADHLKELTKQIKDTTDWLKKRFAA